MKKTLFTLFVCLCSLLSFSQNQLNIPTTLPTEFSNSFTFPLGSKILIELKENQNGKYEYRVLSIEKIEEFYSMEEKKTLFVENPRENTVELFFMGAFYNDGSEDKDWNTLLNLRNNLKKPITYKADIKYYFSDEFENTSIVGAFPGTNTNELWRHKIDYITLYDFEIKTFNLNSKSE